jgi:hypothetical protein
MYTTPLSIIVSFLLLGVILFYLAGVRIGHYRLIHSPESKADGIGSLEGALLGLLALLLSFTFGMAGSRYDARRTLIVQESNDIGTVILRADLYSDSVRAQLKQDLQKYVEKRIVYFEAVEDEAINQARIEAEKISSGLWKKVITLSKESPNVVRDNQMISALNAMIDIVNSRDASRLAIVPNTITYLLFALTLFGSFIIGYSRKTKKHDWIIVALYSLMTVMTLYTILDLDRPRRGFIQTQGPHEKIKELRNYF